MTPWTPARGEPRGAFEGAVRMALAGATLVSAAAVAAIFGFLAYFCLPLLREGQLGPLLSWSWRPFQGEFGILPMALGTLLLSTSAMGIAFPLGLGICGFAHGVGPRWLGNLVLRVVYLMTGIPTVVYGFVSVFLLVPLVRGAFAGTTGFSWLAAAVTLALLVVPTVVLLVDAQLRQVEPGVRLGAASLGLSPAQQFLWVLLPASSRGLLIAALLGFGRAAGDTLISLMVAGNATHVPTSPLDALRTLTAHIALVLSTDPTSATYRSLFLCGLILFAVSTLVNLGLRRLAGGSPSAGSRPR